MEKIRIITDSAADLDNIRPEVTVIPMKISFGSETYLDGVNLSHREFYEKLVESDALPVTSLVSPGEFSDVFEKADAAGEKMLVITISGDLSGTYQSALLAAEEYAGRIRVIDSRQATVGEQVVVNRALQLMDEGLDLDAIADRLEAEKGEIHTIGLLDTLEYLKKGGRISKTVAFVGGALAIKPVVAIEDGKVILLGKARGSKNGENFLCGRQKRPDWTFPGLYVWATPVFPMPCCKNTWKTAAIYGRATRTACPSAPSGPPLAPTSAPMPSPCPFSKKNKIYSEKQPSGADIFRFGRTLDRQKSLAEFAATAANKIKIIFCRGVYLAENTSQAASVRVVRLCGQGVRAADCKKLAESPEGIFRQAKNTPGTAVPGVFVWSISSGHASERSNRCSTRDDRTWARREPWPHRRSGHR